MTPTDAPEPTPAVERAARALDPDAFALRSPRNRALLIPPVIARARKILAAALAIECHEAVADEDGEEQPCNAYAVAYREEVVGDAVLGVYPVCEEHARPPLVPLTAAILGGAR